MVRRINPFIPGSSSCRIRPVNVFVLCTGRCGSMTFVQACSHITNYSAAHESRVRLFSVERFDYPPNHIEADNRLSWFLGALDQRYGNQAAYVHLKRDRMDTAQSYLKRSHRGIIRAYRQNIVVGRKSTRSPLEICLDYCDTVNTNIEAFLKDKSMKMTFRLENASRDFPIFWKLIGAEGDYHAAMGEWEVKHNASS